MRIRLVLVLLALCALLATVTPAAATPFTFYAPNGEPAFGFLGGPWIIGGDAPVRTFPGQYTDLLVAVGGVVPYTRQIGAFTFQGTWTLDDRPPLIDRQQLPQFDFGPLDDCRFGCPVIFSVITRFDFAAAAITDWEPHPLVLDLSVDNDTRRYAFDVMQPVPEPVTLLLFGTTMAGLGLAARWRRRRPN